MKLKVGFIYMFVCIFSGVVYPQEMNNNLLFIRVDKINDLTIDKYQTKFFVIEVDSINIPLKDSGMMPVLIDDFADVQLEDCKRGKSFNINDVYTTDTFNAVSNYGGDNLERIIDNLKEMNYLSSIKIKDLSYSKNIKIYYTIIKSEYCIGNLTDKSDRDYYNNKKIVIMSSPITIDNKYKIPKSDLFEVYKAINYNYFMVD
ncbi:hypothetical protein [Paenimyroides baculatum]|uniref:Uncharacterized protein n=1 Tax=Paenimyroides baculatum TaxID=2608000 RepID=A0A5M6CYF8_9FLAO|nr:hypothetical protein [Paenimyroides baculatum]KAA5538319.1 hypothetical protein F0460_01575 [Paenimyroides baculatum]